MEALGANVDVSNFELDRELRNGQEAFIFFPCSPDFFSFLFNLTSSFCDAGVLNFCLHDDFFVFSLS